MEALTSNSLGVDTNGDGYISWDEISLKYPGLIREVFNQVNTNGDGSTSKEETGLKMENVRYGFLIQKH